MDLTRFDFHVNRFMGSEHVLQMDAAEVGAYMLLLMQAWQMGKDASLPDNPEMLARVARIHGGVPQIVLDRFPVVETQWGKRRRNPALYAEWLRAVDRSEKARANVQKRENVRNKLATPDTSAVQPPINARVTADEPRLDGGSSHTNPNQPIPNQAKTNQPATPGSWSEEPLEDSPETGDEQALGSLQPGEPGYFEEGQYPGGKNPEDPIKGIFPYIAKAWQRCKNQPGARCKYPSRFPEEWELLCAQHAGDILVPAFELWAEAEGKLMTTDMPIAAFLKVAGVYMEKVIPANTLGIRPTVVQSFDEKVAADPALAAALKREEESIKALYAPNPNRAKPTTKEEDDAELRAMGLLDEEPS